MHIAILFNDDHDFLADDPGRAARADILQVVESVESALGAAGARVERVACGKDITAFVGELQRLRPDAVFNLCESLAGDSRGEVAVTTLLDVMGVPYTGSAALPLALACDKHQAKRVLRGAGVPVAAAALVSRISEVRAIDLPFPLIVKPCREDASSGIDADSVVTTKAALARAAERVLRSFHQPALVERFIAGHEIYVPLLGNEPRVALPLTEIHFGPSFAARPRIVTYQGKWDPESADYRDSPTGPPAVTAAVQRRCIDAAQAAFAALGCRDYGRVDLRVTPKGEPFVIDVNPNCDINPIAGFPKAADRAGIDYASLVLRITELALARGPGTAERSRPPRAGRRRTARAKKQRAIRTP